MPGSTRRGGATSWWAAVALARRLPGPRRTGGRGRGRVCRDSIGRTGDGRGSGRQAPQGVHDRAARRLVGGRDDPGLLQPGLGRSGRRLRAHGELAGIDGEGWGLCRDRARGRLMMSDGSATLSLRNPESFELLGRITVHDRNGPVSGLNELECTGTDVWANVWPTGDIARIDPITGRVKATLHIGALPDLPPAARRPGNVNGIAVDTSTHDLLITGKHWPHVYRVRPQPTTR
ncbi:glutaminyl-peptide cyclotransferase [Streptomyces sp. NPDC058637]|uniref:glutaminyl-peptide cyclotransferase n=1 Tax=Streptomyces sp. NPDC058637 TaxID=3346569 RepID=UPI003654059F